MHQAKNNVPFVSLSPVNDSVRAAFASKLSQLFDASEYILGKEVLDFEEKFAAYCNAQYAIGVNSGFDALKVALKVVGVQPNDEVIVPAHTFIATWMAVTDVGAIPVPVDCGIDTYNIDPDLLEAAITPTTKAIIAVHIYGLPAQMDAILQIASKYNLKVIEDNAQAQGATYNGLLTGSMGHINATSFYPSKNLGAIGDAGAITTNHSDLDEAARAFRNYGSVQKYVHQSIGINSRLDTIQAAFLNLKLDYLDSWNNERIQLAQLYNGTLHDLTAKGLVLPYCPPNAKHVYHLYVVRIAKRNELQQYLAARGIQTLIHYPIAIHLQQAYAQLGYKPGDFKIAEEIAETALSLPIYPGLTIEQVHFVCDAISEFFNS